MGVTIKMSVADKTSEITFHVNAMMVKCLYYAVNILYENGKHENNHLEHAIISCGEFMANVLCKCFIESFTSQKKNIGNNIKYQMYFRIVLTQQMHYGKKVIASFDLSFFSINKQFTCISIDSIGIIRLKAQS